MSKSRFLCKSDQYLNKKNYLQKQAISVNLYLILIRDWVIFNEFTCKGSCNFYKGDN